MIQGIENRSTQEEFSVSPNEVFQAILQGLRGGWMLGVRAAERQEGERHDPSGAIDLTRGGVIQGGEIPRGVMERLREGRHFERGPFLGLRQRHHPSVPLGPVFAVATAVEDDVALVPSPRIADDVVRGLEDFRERFRFESGEGVPSNRVPFVRKPHHEGKRNLFARLHREAVGQETDLRIGVDVDQGAKVVAFHRFDGGSIPLQLVQKRDDVRIVGPSHQRKDQPLFGCGMLEELLVPRLPGYDVSGMIL